MEKGKAGKAKQQLPINMSAISVALLAFACCACYAYMYRLYMI